MKTSLLTIFALAIAAGPVLGEDEHDQPKQTKSRFQAPQKQVNRTPQAPKVRQNVNVSPRFQARVNRPPPKPVYTAPTNRVVAPNVHPRTRTFSPNVDEPRIQSDVNVSNTDFRTRVRNKPPVVTQQPPTTTIPSDTTVQPDTTVQSDPNTRNRDWRNRDGRNRDRNRTGNTNRNWRNYNPSGTYNYSDARRHHHRQRHHRSWWRSRYNRIALFAGGYYYWSNNYWYPAYGYDPYYSNYTYDEPIYGYNNLTPGQVIANVQNALQEQGYYQDAVDGLIGPRTRAALSDFQRDNGLPITAAIDGPTLKALGLY